MPLSPEQRQRVLDSIATGRLPFGPPSKMYGAHGNGRACDGCGEAIERTQIEWEAVYENGQAYHLHLGCAAFWDAERRRRIDVQQTHGQARAIRDEAQATRKESAQLRDRADALAREAEAVIEESEQVRRGQPPQDLGC